jgi:hypothetical protein
MALISNYLPSEYLSATSFLTKLHEICKLDTMVKKRVLVGYGIDVDAVSNHINTTVGGKPNLMNVSRGEHYHSKTQQYHVLLIEELGVFGATRGVERLLQLWERKNIKCSWYIPGHTIETFPEEMAKIRDAGHEMYAHYIPRSPGFLILTILRLVGYMDTLTSMM